MSAGYVCSGIAGIEGIPVLIQTTPLLDGTAVPNIYIPQPGSIAIGILVGWPAGGAESDYYALLDRFVRAFINRRNEIPVPLHSPAPEAGRDPADTGLLPPALIRRR